MSWRSQKVTYLAGELTRLNAPNWGTRHINRSGGWAVKRSTIAFWNQPIPLCTAISYTKEDCLVLNVEQLCSCCRTALSLGSGLFTNTYLIQSDLHCAHIIIYHHNIHLIKCILYCVNMLSLASSCNLHLNKCVYKSWYTVLYSLVTYVIDILIVMLFGTHLIS